MELKDKLDLIGKAIAAIIALIGLFKTLYEYQKAQKWKKAEFLAKEAKEFFSDKYVSRALTILDYNSHFLPVYENEIPDKKQISYDNEFLIKALATNTENFTLEDKLIRLIFDEFLTKLSNFNKYLETKLITIDDLRPYLKYWINIIGNPVKSQRNSDVMKQLWNFIDYYEYNEVRELVLRFGFTPNFASKAASGQ